jgi:hypothetical protein
MYHQGCLRAGYNNRQDKGFWPLLVVYSPDLRSGGFMPCLTASANIFGEMIMVITIQG